MNFTNTTKEEEEEEEEVTQAQLRYGTTSPSTISITFVYILSRVVIIFFYFLWNADLV